MNQIVIDADLGTHTISRHIYGHFAEHLGRCIYGGIWVGEDSPIPNVRGIRSDVVAALRQIRIPVLRWPGGCFADEYHWMDGVGPKSERPEMVNTHWGGVTENNHFGTHEFMDLCAQLGCEPYICGNVGSGTVQEMQQWVEYLTFDGKSPMADLRREHGRDDPWAVKFWGVGNENWGCGGRMRPEFYADQYRRFATYLRDLGDNVLHKIACGPNSDNYHWTEVLMAQTEGMHTRPGKPPFMAGLALHYYTRLGRPGDRGSATAFGEDAWFAILRNARVMETLVEKHSTIMDRYDPEKRVDLIVDEWGTWYEVEPGTNPGFLYQQNSLRDALVAGLTLNIFNRHSDRVRMANIAQTVNVLQAMVLTEGERMIKTPTYHVFDMYKVHQDATLLPLDLTCGHYTFGEAAIPRLDATASRDQEGRVHLTLCNLDPHQEVDISCDLRGADVSTAEGQVLTADAINAHNTFEDPDAVVPQPLDGAHVEDGAVSFTMPAKSVVLVSLS
jgi:alpha-N-arabinofuranosidase